MQKRTRTVILSLFFVVFICNIGYAANDIKYPKPNNDFYVYDEAKIVSEETKDLILDVNKKLNKETGAQIVVATVKDLQDTNLEEYTNNLFSKWKIGDKKKNNGILFLIAQNDKAMRIEIGYGLEGAINDGKAGEILNDHVVPRFKQENYDEGIQKGFLEIAKIVQKEYGIEIDAIDEAENKELTTSILVLSVILVLIVLITIFIDGDGGGSGGGSTFYSSGNSFSSSGGSFGGGGFSGGGGASRSW